MCAPMVARLLTRSAPGWLSPGTRIYAIGDVHGCAGRLWEMHERIRADLAAQPAQNPLLIHLGDYVDRGPDSAAVVKRLAAGPVLRGVPMICLRGNHEQMMLDALRGDRDAVQLWLANSGRETLESWSSRVAEGPAQWRHDLMAELPFLQELPIFHRVDGYVFVHAGLRPGVEMRRQSDEDMLWIREGFLDWRGVLLPEAPGVAAVHGHTPRPEPEVTGNRVGVDTGAVGGGDLTCAVLEHATVRFLTA